MVPNGSTVIVSGYLASPAERLQDGVELAHGLSGLDRN